MRRATPMLVVLICIELSDIVFAVDSIPAVVGISQASRTISHDCSAHLRPQPPSHIHKHGCPPRRIWLTAPARISQDPFVVYTSNCFALLALRSLYTLLAKSVQQLHYLRHAVALILGFVGCKMTLEFFHVDVGSVISLVVIVGLLIGGTVLSLVKNRREQAGEEADPHNQGHHLI